MRIRKNSTLIGAGLLAVAAVATGVLLLGGANGNAAVANAAAAEPAAEPSSPQANKPKDSVDLTEAQAKTIRVSPAATYTFEQQRTAVGSIDFNENRSVQVFTPYQGKIIQAFGDIGDVVAKGKILYTIDSPDLVQAESALIAAAGVYDLTSAALARAKDLYGTKGIAEKDMQQAMSDQQTAEGALKAAREAVRVFGKSDGEIDSIVAKRKIDPALVVVSPIGGRITARAAQPGLFVQPGNAPAPFTIADVSTKWMLANVPESESASFRLGQEVKVRILAMPERIFQGRITTVGETVDPYTHTLLVRSEIADPAHELRPGMLANFVIRTGDPLTSVAVPQNGVVREGDGTMSVWVTADRHHFVKRTVKIGLQQGELDQIVEGLQAGELVATDGAIFLSNMLVAAPDS